MKLQSSPLIKETKRLQNQVFALIRPLKFVKLALRRE